MPLKAYLKPASPVSAWQFGLFRALLGFYLVVHFLHLLPWAGELFSDAGMFPDPDVLPLAGLFPNPLNGASPAGAQGFLLLLAILATLLALGLARPWVCVGLWFGWTALFHRAPLISNPGLPYIGSILLFCALVPPGEALVLGRLQPRSDWQAPAWSWRGPFFLLMAGYTFSGFEKLGSPSWTNGEALRLLAENPLARPWFFRDLLMACPPWSLRLATWGALAMELSALPLCMFRRGRPVAWFGLLGLQLGILCVIDFADLTLGMVLAHLFVFDPHWWPGRKKASEDSVQTFVRPSEEPSAVPIPPGPRSVFSELVPFNYRKLDGPLRQP